MQHFSFATQEPFEFEVSNAQHRLPLIHRATSNVLRRRRQVRHEGGRQQRKVRNLLQIFLHVLNLWKQIKYNHRNANISSVLPEKQCF